MCGAVRRCGATACQCGIKGSAAWLLLHYDVILQLSGLILRRSWQLRGGEVWCGAAVWCDGGATAVLVRNKGFRSLAAAAAAAAAAASAGAAAAAARAVVVLR